MMFADRMEENQGLLIADIAAHVFSFLSVKDKQNVAKVCRNWRRIVYLAGLWRDVTVELPLHPSHELVESLKVRGITRITCLRSKEEHLSDLVNSIPNLTHLNITGCPQVGEEFLVKVIPSLSCLKHVGFRRCRQVTDKLLKTMSASNLPKILKSLVLEECEFVTHVGFKALMKTSNNLENLDLKCVEQLNNSCLEVLSDSCPKLTSLTINDSKWVTYSGLEFVARKLRNIKHLDLQHCRAVNDESIKLLANNLDLEHLHINNIPYVAEETMAVIARNLAGLRSLSIGSYKMYTVSEADVFKAMLEEVSKLQKLESLVIRVLGTDMYNNDMDLCILSSLKKLPNIKNLDLGFIQSISDDTMIQLADYMPHLEKLSYNTKTIKDLGINILCTKLKQLKALNIEVCKLTEKGVKQMSLQLEKLQTLVLDYGYYGNLTRAGIKHVAINLESLTSLSLLKSPKINDTDVNLIALCMPQLVRLDLQECIEVTDKGAILIGKHLKNLCDLRLVCTSTLDKGFVFVSKNLTKLQMLFISGCSISDKALIDGAMSLGNLKEFEFGCEQTTDEGLEEAVQYLSGLTEMTLCFANNVTEKGIGIIVKGLPNLNHLVIEECDMQFSPESRYLDSIGLKVTIY